jgi:hypothetical protein
MTWARRCRSWCAVPDGDVNICICVYWLLCELTTLLVLHSRNPISHTDRRYHIRSAMWYETM